MKIVIDGIPIAKSRHRCGCRGRIAISYDPQVKSEMESVKKKILNAWNVAFDSDNKDLVIEASRLAQATSFKVRYTFVFPTNKSDSTTQKNAKLWGFEPHNVKPDVDNLEKFYSDCATGVIWSDDAQVTFSESKKFFDKNPRTEIEIMVKEDLKMSPNAKGVLLVFGPDKLKEFLRDVSAFWAWPASRVDEVVEAGKEKSQENVLSAAANLLAEFADKYSKDLSKISKFNKNDQFAGIGNQIDQFTASGKPIC